MKTVEEIKRSIETYRIILRNSELFSPPYNFACGAIQALEEVLKKVEDNQ